MILFVLAATPGVPPVAADVVRTSAPGSWSASATWERGRIPARNDTLHINHQVTIGPGVRAEAGETHIQSGGRLTLSGDELNAFGSVVVHGGGELRGKSGGINFHVANDRRFSGEGRDGRDPSNPDYRPSDVGLWALGGSRVILRGPRVTSWLDALPLTDSAVTDEYGAEMFPTIDGDTVTLASTPVGWQVNDRIALTSIHQGYAFARITAVQGNVVTYSDVSVRDFTAFTLCVEGRCLRPKVANLTRRLVIGAPDVTEAEPYHRAHTAFLRGARVRISGVEFRNLGVRGVLGRYPVYFNKMGPAGCSLENSSINQAVRDPGSRLVVIRDTDNCRVADNVAVGSMGRGFLIDGTSTGNVLIGNLSAGVLELAGDTLTSREELPVAASGTWGFAYHFAIRGTGNIVQNNVAIGATPDGLAGLTAVDGRTPVAPASGGLEVLANSADGAANALSNAEIRDLQVYNVPYGVAATTGTHLHGLVVALSGTSFSPDVPASLGSDLLTLDNPMLVYNVIQLTSWGQFGLTVNGGILLGRDLLWTPNQTSFTFNDTHFYGTRFMYPDAFALAGLIQGAACRIRLVDTADGMMGAHLFGPDAGRITYMPGVARFRCPDGRINGVARPQVFNADYTKLNAQNVAPIAGMPAPFGACETTAPDQPCVVRNGGARRLTAALSQSTGFIRPPNLPNTVVGFWRVAGAGERPIGGGDVPALFEIVGLYLEDEGTWFYSLFGDLRGVGFGYPALSGGTLYDVQVETRNWDPNIPGPADTLDGTVEARRVLVFPERVTNFEDGIPIPVAHLRAIVRGDPPRPAVGDVVTYTVSYKHIGQIPAASSFIRATVPRHTDYMTEEPASDGGVYDPTPTSRDNGHVTWTLPSVQPGEGGSLTFRVRVNSADITAPPVRADTWFCADGQDASVCDNRSEHGSSDIIRVEARTRRARRAVPPAARGSARDASGESSAGSRSNRASAFLSGPTPAARQEQPKEARKGVMDFHLVSAASAPAGNNSTDPAKAPVTEVAHVDLLSPADGITLVHSPVTFAWTASGPIVRSRVDVIEEGRTDPIVSTLVREMTYTLPQLYLSMLTIGGRYGWRIIGLNAQGQPVSETPIRRFIWGPEPPPGTFVARQVLAVLPLDSQMNIPAVVADLTTRHGLKTLDVSYLKLIHAAVAQFEIVTTQTVGQVVSALGRDPRVSFAQPNTLHATSGDNTDPLVGLQYGLSMMGVHHAHRRGVTGKGVKVAMLDTAVEANHPDLHGRIERANVAGDETRNETYHATGVAGAIGAIAGNGIGGRGVAPDVSLLAVRACQARASSPMQAECTAHNLAKGMDFAVQRGARVVNLSLGGPARDGLMARVLEAAHTRGVVLVAAAGNGGPTAPPSYPAADPYVIAVTAVDAHRGLYPSATRGESIAVAAPGVEVITTVPGARYGAFSGTSIAAAHVTGVVALMLQVNPGLTPDEVRSLLTSTAEALGPRERFGHGLVNACRALQPLFKEPIACH